MKEILKVLLKSKLTEIVTSTLWIYTEAIIRVINRYSLEKEHKYGKED